MAVTENAVSQSLVEAVSRLSSGGAFLGVMLVVGGIPVAVAVIIALLNKLFARTG